MLQFVDRQLEQGRQAYVVYPVIEESEKTDLKAATTMFEALAAGPFAARRLALLHGRIPADERDDDHAPLSRPARSICSSRRR